MENNTKLDYLSKKMLRLKLFSAFIFCITFSVSAQESSNSTRYVDSIRQILVTDGLDPDLVSIALLDSIADIYNGIGDKCAELEVRIFQGELLNIKGQYEKSLKMGIHVFESFDSKCDSLLIIKNYARQAVNYIDLLSYKTAINTITTALIHYNKSWGETLELAELFNQRAKAHFWMSQYEEAYKDYRKVFSIATSLEDEFQIQRALYNIGNLKFATNDKDSARYYIQGALISAKKSKKPLEIIKVFNTMAGLSKDATTQMAYADSALQIAIKHRAYLLISDLYRNRALSFSNVSNYKMAFEDMWLVAEYKDTVFSEQLVNAVANMKEKYESEKKALEIVNLRLKAQDAELESALYKSNQTKLLLGSLVLILAVLILAFRYYSIRKRKNILAHKNMIIAKEKKRSDDLLLNILPYEVAEELKDKGQARARSFDNVTILFTDFEEFTRVTESMPPERLVEEINICFKAFDEISTKHGVEKIKTIGDAYMAAGGLNNNNSSDTRNVVLAALEIQQFMLDRKNEKLAKNETPFDMRVGIHTGPVVAGIVGVKKFQYDIWGDTVNTAARMESSCEIGRINISQVTFELIKRENNLKFESRGRIEVKGKGEMEMWYVDRV